MSSNKCYLSPAYQGNTSLKIMHLIITRFMIEFWPFDDFKNRIYKNDYIINGIRVMKKYLLPSLENQSCQDFIWILKIGDKANITYIKSLLNFTTIFRKDVIYEKDIRNYTRLITKSYDVLITSRIDYDDRIYYDAVNDVRKLVNVNRPMMLYGYNRGLYYFESDNKYYELIEDFNQQGVMSVFVSLIVILNKVNDTYNIFDLGTHILVRARLKENYRSFGINELNYEPSLFEKGDMKFIWVRQNYSGIFNYSMSIKKTLKEYNLNLSKFYGK